MVIKLNSVLCKVMLHKHMMWAWCFWWMESARAGNDYTTYVRIGWNNKARRQQIKQINWM